MPHLPTVETGTSAIPLAMLSIPGEGLPPMGRRLANADRTKPRVGAGVLHLNSKGRWGDEQVFSQAHITRLETYITHDDVGQDYEFKSPQSKR